MSLLYFLTYFKAAGGFEPIISAKELVGGQELKIKGGAWRVCHRLLERVGSDKLHTNSPVFAINQTEKYVEVTCKGGQVYRCDRVVLAVPPHQAAKILYSPSLPVNKLHVLQRMPVGYLNKVIVTYKKAFWREAGYSGEAVTTGGPSTVAEYGPLCIVFDGTTCNESPALVGFIGGRQQLEYSRLTPEARQDAVLQCLAHLFGADAQHYLDYIEKDWNQEPYNGGCPVSVATPGVMTSILPGLRLPFQRLHFAGTESATIWCGFLNGAVEAGYRAANEVLYNLRPQAVSAHDLVGTAYDITLTGAHMRKRPQVKLGYGLRLTIGLAVISILAVVGRKAFFRMAL